MSLSQYVRVLPRPALDIKTFATAGIISLIISGCGGGAGLGSSSSSDSDPLAVDTPVAYVKRPVPQDDDNNVESEDVLEPAIYTGGDTFNGGAALFIKDRGNLSAAETNISDAAFPAGTLYDVKDVEVSFDGRKLVFAMRILDPNLDNDDPLQPTWNIWEYDLDANSLQPIIGDAIRAEEGHDISPYYLPDDRIVFTSTRQVRSRAVLLDEIKPDASTNGAGFSATTDDEEIFNLHIVDPINDPNGINIQQITFSQGHDLQPTVLQDGRIAFLRSDMGDNRDNLSIYTINSDGSNLRILYGYHSQQTGNAGAGVETTFVDFRELNDGTLSAILQPRDSAQLGGDIIQINTDGFIDNNQPTFDNSGDSGTAQRSLTVRDVEINNNISVHGHFNAAYPLNGSQDFLVSWNLCFQTNADDETVVCDRDNDGVVDDPSLAAAPASFGLWGYDTANGTQRPIVTVEQGEMVTDVAIMESRALPPVSEADPATFDTDLESEGLAVLHIRSVYDTDGTDTSTNGIGVLADPAQTLAAERPARFIRLVKPVSIPSEDVLDFDNSAFGINNNGRGMREILGYAPIEPDGSVSVKVPADVAFYVDVVDADGERIAPLHRNLVQVKSGETYQCTGCHTTASELPHGRIDAEAPSANPGGAQFGLPFPNTEPALFIDQIGETMAQVFTRINTDGARDLSTGLIYTDDWTDPAVRAKDLNTSIRYEGMTTPSPASDTCEDAWQPGCRTVINYTDHIQPLWEASRPGGACIDCHNRVSSDDPPLPQTPAGQLELTNVPVADNNNVTYLRSYRELLTQDVPVIANPNGGVLVNSVLLIVDGVQQFYLDAMNMPILDIMGDPIPEVRPFQDGDDVNDIFIRSFTGTDPDIYLDSMGAPILDAGGDEIPLFIPIDPSDIPNGPTMSTSNAAGSSFFDTMESTAGTVDHSGFMGNNELRLLREWLDIGGQYYNNPFDAPLN